MTLVEALSKPEGTEFYSLEKFEIVSQGAPKTAKNGEIYSAVNLKAGSKTCWLRLWGGAASWRIPQDVEILRGTFVRDDYLGQHNLLCSSLTQPEGSEPFGDEDIQGITGKVSIAKILQAGKRGAEWAEKQEGSIEMQVAAFTMAATAKMNGHPDN